MFNRLVLLLIGILINTLCGAEEERTIAITIDDLPFVGSVHYSPGNMQRDSDRFHKILSTLTEHKIPATGFIIAGAIAKGEWEWLEEFRAAGFLLGNHTFSHKSLGGMSAEKYIADLDRADVKLTPIMTEPKYFRYPYLAEGNGEKKQKVQTYLKEHDYTIAPVTIDSKDYNFNARLLAIPFRQRDNHLSQIKKSYLDYIWKQTLRAENASNKRGGSQILLLHANLLNSHFLGDVIDLYQNNGYKIISLNEALKSHATPLTDTDNETLLDALGVYENMSSFLK